MNFDHLDAKQFDEASVPPAESTGHAELRRKLARDVLAFLADGGEIEVVPEGVGASKSKGDSFRVQSMRTWRTRAQQ